MAYRFEQDLVAPSETQLASAFIDAMGRVYLWMAGGLALTALVATLVGMSDGIAALVLGKPYIYIGLFVAQVVLVLVISGTIEKLAPGLALGLFFLYSALVGATLSTVLLVHDLGTVGLAFGVTAATFTAMAVVGLTMKRDLTDEGPVLLMALFGLIVASVANSFLQSNGIEWLISFAGVLIFMGLTAYDAKTIKAMTVAAMSSGDSQAVSRVGILGALSLYLDVINLFLFILSFLGSDE